MNEIKKQEIIKNWTDENSPIGKMLGYPDCCVKAFCDIPPELMDKPTKDDIRRYKSGCINGEFSGFIPCSEHAKQIVQGKITLESLIDVDKRENNEEYYLPEFPNAITDR